MRLYSYKYIINDRDFTSPLANAYEDSHDISYIPIKLLQIKTSAILNAGKALELSGRAVNGGHRKSLVCCFVKQAIVICFNDLLLSIYSRNIRDYVKHQYSGIYNLKFRLTVVSFSRRKVSCGSAMHGMSVSKYEASCVRTWPCKFTSYAYIYTVSTMASDANREQISVVRAVETEVGGRGI